MKVIEPGVLYALENFTGADTQLVRFTRKRKSGEFDNGTTVEEVISLLIDKLYEFQKRSPSDENQQTINYLQHAQNTLKLRLKKKLDLKHADSLSPGRQ